MTEDDCWTLAELGTDHLTLDGGMGGGGGAG